MSLFIIIVGVILGYIFGLKLLLDNVMFHGPDSNKIRTQIFYCLNTEKYYKFTPVPYICPPMYANSSRQKLLQQKIIQPE